MKFRLATVTVLLAFSLTGCQVVRHELQTSGGFAGHVLDSKLLNANGSKKAQLLRAAVIVALASRVAVGTLRNGDDADQFVRRLQIVNRELNYLGGDIYPITGKTQCSGIEDGGCDSRAVFFESNLPQLEYKVVRMLVAALPQREAAAFAAEATGGNVWSAAYKFIKMGFRSADGGHRGAAAFRSSTEILARASSPAGCGSVEAARACLRLAKSDPLFLLAGSNALAEGDIDQNLVSVYVEMMKTSCSLLPLSSDPGDDSANVRTAECRTLKFEPSARPMPLRP